MSLINSKKNSHNLFLLIRKIPYIFSCKSLNEFIIENLKRSNKHNNILMFKIGKNKPFDFSIGIGDNSFQGKTIFSPIKYGK